jgi:hypothetical protein
MLRYYLYFPVQETVEYKIMIAQNNYNLLRWLLRAHLFHPRVVKPACADGTAVMWEVCRRLSLKNPINSDRVFFVRSFMTLVLYKLIFCFLGFSMPYDGI